ncbi:SDR family NAD(P)-dependent oxidoreductase [Gemella morbillorum]|uniref:SDR family NAD(P)-dependent oxidoreductase n=1 Tax=Gemella morbillorum TaxID=29391 RepID=UPI0028D4C2AE|nr:SDR family NAD(P)-dependent oxidoreductase [Gemella morbillorum]
MTKTILITGSTDGIGKHLAKKLASEGHEVIIHGRNPKKIEKAYEEVNAYSKQGLVHAYKADLQIMDDIYTLVSKLKNDFSKIDVVINNAGVYASSTRTATKENVELTFMLSVLVPYILSIELKELLEKSSNGRIINTSSFMHHFASVGNLDFGFERKYTPGLAYNNSKLYTIWITRYLAKLLRNNDSNIVVNSYHPGLISTNLGNDTSDAKVQKSLFGKIMKKLSKNLDEGIETGYYLALSEQVAHINGKYFDNNKVSYTSEKGYSLAKEQRLVEYCNEKINNYKRKLND